MPLPSTERNKGRVGDHETQGEIVADETAHKSGWWKDLVQLGDALLDGVGTLGENQEQEDARASMFRKI